MIKRQKKSASVIFFCLLIYSFLTKLQKFFLPMTTFLQLCQYKVYFYSYTVLFYLFHCVTGYDIWPWLIDISWGGAKKNIL